MASTYENDLRLEEMATGENSGSWGTKTNTNLELIADAFSYGTESIANADTTITIADGAADAARSLALKINSSADLTTTRTITLAPNTTSKVWIIENNTSGGQTLTISAGSGSNVTLANGTTKIIATDGIGAGSNVVELTQDLAIADMSVDGILSLADGSNSAPSLTNTGDTNTGLYFPAADEVGITTGGTQRVKVDSTGVDITGTAVTDGVTSSGVISAEKARSNTAGDGQILISPSDTTVEFAFRHDQTDNKLVLDATTSGTWGPNASFNTNKDIIFYDTSGNASFVYDESAGTTFNEAGADRDFRVESDGNANMLFVDAGNDHVNIGIGTDRGGVLNVYGTGTPIAVIESEADGTVLSLRSTDTDANAGPSLELYRNATGAASDNLGSIIVKGTDASAQDQIYFSIGTQISAAGNGAEASTVFFQNAVAGTVRERITMSSSALVINQEGLDNDFRVESDDNANMLLVDASNSVVCVGTSDTSVAGNTGSARGVNINHGYIEAAMYQDVVMYLNRMNNDGVILDFKQDGSTEGTVSVSGSTVSYNGFAGRHESSGIPTTTARGTVVSTIDELDVYLSGNKQGQTRADHAKVEVSNSVGDPCVYGVVDDFTDDGSVNVTSVGIAPVRVTGSCAKGDLLESNGDGTAKVQSDDIIRSKTIGKVTIGNSDTGVKLVSCVMYCG